MEDDLVQIWPIYDQQLNSFLLEIGSEGQGKRPSFRKVLPIHGQEGSAWIMKSQAAGLDVRTGFQGYSGGHRNFRTYQTAQAQRPQQVDITPQQNQNLPTPVQHPIISLRPTIKTTGPKCPRFDQSDSWIHEREQAMGELEDQTHHCTQAESIIKSSSPLLHKAVQSNCNQEFVHLEKAMPKSPSPSSYETPHPSSLSSQIQAFNGRFTGTNQEVKSTPSTQPLNRKRSQDTADQEVDLLHLTKRPCGSMRQSYRPSTPSALQYESSSIISEGTAQSIYGLGSCIDHVGVSGNHHPTLGYQSSPSARVQGQSSASVVQSRYPPEQPHRSPLDNVRAPGASRAISGYQSPYLPMNDAQTTNIHQQTVIPTVDTSAVPQPIHRLPYGTNHPMAGANWSESSSYNGPSFSSSRSSEPAKSRCNGPLNVSFPEKEVTEASEGYRWLPEPVSPERKNAGPSDASVQTTEDPQTQSELNLERMRSLPCPQTYYEYTGGMLPNRHPRETGICSNMDSKTKTFIDAHGATFTGSRSGPYRYMKPESRAQELAMIKAIYQTIVDFELYIGSSPRQKLQTWESYEFQYRQIQLELMERWVGPPELMPKLR